LCDLTLSRFSRTPTCDGRTDGQTDGHRAMASTVDAEHRAVKIKQCKQKYGRLPEKLQLIESAAYVNQTKLFSMNCNKNNNKFDASRCQILRQKCTKFDLSARAQPQIPLGEYTAPQLLSCI